MKDKLGLYAQYSKLDGSLVISDVKMKSDVYKSNKNNSNLFWELITDNPKLIYDYPEEYIPKISKSFDEDMIKEVSSHYYECECCFEYYTKDEMYHISNNDNNCAISICKYCSI